MHHSALGSLEFQYSFPDIHTGYFHGRVFISDETLPYLDHSLVNIFMVDHGCYYEMNPIEQYCVNKMLQFRRLHVHSRYTVEDNEVVPHPQSRTVFAHFEEDIRRLIRLETNIEKVLFILEQDYGYIADILCRCRHASIEVFTSLSDIQPSSSYHRMKLPDTYFADLHDAPAYGVVYKGRIIDGHHRYKALMNQTDIKEFPYIVLH